MCSGWCCRVGFAFRASVLHISGFSEDASVALCVLPDGAARRHSCFVALVCSLVRLLNLSQQPPNHFTASFCCGPEVLCGLRRTCSPNAWICCLLFDWSADALVRCHSVIELSRPIVAAICRSVEVFDCTNHSLDCSVGSLDVLQLE